LPQPLLVEDDRAFRERLAVALGERGFTDDEEVIFAGQQPALINGIDEVATRPDGGARKGATTCSAHQPRAGSR